jgi:hypothetical protein
MPPSRRSSEAPVVHGERGSASLEFLTVGMILLVPLVYLILAMAAIQAGAFGVEGAARQAARIAAQQATGEADVAVERAVRIALADYGVDPASATVVMSCGGGCAEPGTRVSVTVRATVPLPLVPEVLALTPVGSIRLEASATQTVSRFAGAGS